MKTWYQSKTVWFAIITIAVAALTQFTTIEGVPDSWRNWVLMVVGALNAILRIFSTSQTIEPASVVKVFKEGGGE